MIVSVSGRIGHGKDEIGSIIQYLTSESSNKNGKRYRDYKTFKEKGGGSNLRNFDRHYVSNFEIKKFANKLKDIVCMIIGCTREQLEDRDFKEKELGEEWWYWVENITGKIIKPYSVKEVNDYMLVKLTPRLLLQLLGTDCGRDIIHPNIWVNSLMSEYKTTGYKIPNSELGAIYDAYNSAMEDDETFENILPNWIITDTRFPNELKAIKDRGGISVRVNRNSDTQFSTDIPHPSETALDNAEFDYIIDNNGTIEELIEKVREILIKENIL